jgi:hypothetical protein
MYLLTPNVTSDTESFFYLFTNNFELMMQKALKFILLPRNIRENNPLNYLISSVFENRPSVPVTVIW